MQEFNPRSRKRNDLDNVEKVLAHPVRAAFLRELDKSPVTPSELASLFEVSPYNLFHQLVGQREAKGRGREYFLLEPDRPKSIVMDFTPADRRSTP